MPIESKVVVVMILDFAYLVAAVAHQPVFGGSGQSVEYLLVVIDTAEVGFPSLREFCPFLVAVDLGMQSDCFWFESH